MAKVIFEKNGIVSLESIAGEEDLKPRPGIRCTINPPPNDGRCLCCGRHLTELRPFDFDGALLVQRFRPHSPPDEELDAIWEKYTWNCDSKDDYRKAKERMIQELGQEEADSVEIYAQARATSYASWECRECFLLDSRTYHERICERYRKSKA